MSSTELFFDWKLVETKLRNLKLDWKYCIMTINQILLNAPSVFCRDITRIQKIVFEFFILQSTFFILQFSYYNQRLSSQSTSTTLFSRWNLVIICKINFFSLCHEKSWQTLQWIGNKCITRVHCTNSGQGLRPHKTVKFCVESWLCKYCSSQDREGHAIIWKGQMWFPMHRIYDFQPPTVQHSSPCQTRRNDAEVAQHC